MGHESQFVFCIVVFTLSLQFDNVAVIELQIKSNLFFHSKPFKHTFQILQLIIHLIMDSAGSKEHVNTPSIKTKATYYFLNRNHKIV